MLINTYKKINIDRKTEQFSMPLSLRIIKMLGQESIYWKDLHLVDVLSLYYSIMIDNANEHLLKQKQEKLQERGISEVRPASVDDFDKL